MTYDPETYSIPELARLIKDLGRDVESLSTEVRALGGAFITRAEFEAWRTAYDREIVTLKEHTAPVRVSGWTIASFAVAAIVGLGSLLALAITLINVIP